MSSSQSSAGERSIGKASTLEDSAVDFQRVFLSSWRKKMASMPAKIIDALMSANKIH